MLAYPLHPKDQERERRHLVIRGLHYPLHRTPIMRTQEPRIYLHPEHNAPITWHISPLSVKFQSSSFDEICRGREQCFRDIFFFFCLTNHQVFPRYPYANYTKAVIRVRVFVPGFIFISRGRSDCFKSV